MDRKMELQSMAAKVALIININIKLTLLVRILLEQEKAPRPLRANQVSMHTQSSIIKMVMGTVHRIICQTRKNNQAVIINNSFL